MGCNERLLARALRGTGAKVRIVTKGGMTRVGDAWVPDGRSKAIAADCEASLAALDGLEIDTYLLHAPDPRTPWRTSLRALARLAESGLVKRVGVSNVNLPQLEEAAALAPIAAVQVALSALDDRAVRGGVVSRCVELGITLIAHSPLGGPRRSAGLARRQPFARAAAAHSATPAEVALAWVLGVSDNVVAIPGARRPESARSAAHAARLTLDADERDAIAPAKATAAPRSRGRAGAGSGGAQVVLLIGIPGAGKTRLADSYVDRGFARLNRDERGGSLRQIAEELDVQLADGAGKVLLDNTYLTRAVRSYAIDAAARHGAQPSCVWLDTPLDQAQINLVERILERFGELPTAEELRAAARRAPGLMLPTSQMRALRELEPPTLDEGFVTIDRVPFVRVPEAGAGTAAVLVAARSLAQSTFQSPDPTAAHLVFDWRPEGELTDLDGVADALRASVRGSVHTALCPHGGGPPSCWCRPPLPGLPLAFAREHEIDLASSTLVGVSPAHRTLARALRMLYMDA